MKLGQGTEAKVDSIPSGSIALDLALVLLVVVLFVVMSGTFAPQPQQPGVDINVRT